MTECAAGDLPIPSKPPAAMTDSTLSRLHLLLPHLSR